MDYRGTYERFQAAKGTPGVQSPPATTTAPTAATADAAAEVVAADEGLQGSLNTKRRAVAADELGSTAADDHPEPVQVGGIT